MAGLQLKYFVLKPAGSGAHAAASRAALRRYADLIEALEPELARDLRMWADREAAETLVANRRLSESLAEVEHLPTSPGVLGVVETEPGADQVGD